MKEETHSKRKSCVACGSHEFTLLHNFKNFPVYMGVADDETKLSEDEKEDMEWSFCNHCGLVQLTNLINLDLLYHKGHNTAVGRTWRIHHEKFSEFISKNNDQDEILEIGGGNLVLAENTLAKISDLKLYQVFDKNKYKDPGSEKIKFTQGFFDIEKLSKNDFKSKTVIHSHLLEHVYDPMYFLNCISRRLSVGQKMIFAVPDIEKMMRKNYTNSLNFEHTFYLDKLFINDLMDQAGFVITSHEVFNDDILFICAEKHSKPTEKIETSRLKDRYKNSVDVVRNFIDFHLSLINKLNSQIGLDPNDKVYVFGAHIFTQFLIEFGLDSKKILGILDNDDNKKSKRLYGTDLKIHSPKVLSGLDSPQLILRAAQYNDEIKEDIFNNINKTVRYLT